jgi:hypothetical protein
VNHYTHNWKGVVQAYQLKAGPINELTFNFSILEFPPNAQRAMWTYATCGMSNQGDARPLELHLFSPIQHIEHIELLTAIAHYHLTGNYLDLGHTGNFGRPWMFNSKCDHGLISLPYLDGPALEWLETERRRVRFLWLIPITKEECLYKKEHGLEKLEILFEKETFNYLDIDRKGVI